MGIHDEFGRDASQESITLEAGSNLSRHRRQAAALQYVQENENNPLS